MNQSKMKNLFYSILFLFAVTFFTACDSTESADQMARVDLSMKAVSSDISISAARSLNESIVIEEAMIGVEEIELESEQEAMEEEENETEDGDDSEEEDEMEIEYEWEGAYAFDLLTGQSEPAIDFTEVPAGIYTEFEAEFSPVLPNNTTMIINGTFVNGSNDTLRFEYTYAGTAEMEIESDAGFQLDPALDNSVLVSIDLTALLNGVVLSDAVVDSDNVVRINKDSNVEIANLIETNFDNATDFDEDDEDESEEDDDESDD